MSLVNDALRRASQKPKAPADPGAGGPGSGGPDEPPLRPLPPRNDSGGPRTLIVVLAVLALLVGGWFLYRGWDARRRPAVDQRAAVTNDAPGVIANPIRTNPVVRLTNPPPPALVVTQVVTQTVVQVTVPVPPTNPPAATNAVAVTNAAVPKPEFPALKLQGIFYRSDNPFVMLNGKTLFMNDEIDKVRVTAITVGSVTLVWNGQTNILKLR